MGLALARGEANKRKTDINAHLTDEGRLLSYIPAFSSTQDVLILQAREMDVLPFQSLGLWKKLLSILEEPGS